MSFKVALYWNNFLGFQGPPVTRATFDAITYDGKTPIYARLRAEAGGPLDNIYDVERFASFGNIRYTGWHPLTGEERVNEARADTGGHYTWVV